MPQDKEPKVMTEAAITPKVEEGPIDLTDRVTVYATDSAPFHGKGETVEASQFVADKMLANGWATKEKPKDK